MSDPSVVSVVLPLITALIAAVGAAAYGFRKLTAANVKVLEARIDTLEEELQKEQARTGEERARTQEARRETDQVRREKEALRQEKDSDLDRLRALRLADQVDHEQQMQARTQELGGTS